MKTALILALSLVLLVTHCDSIEVGADDKKVEGDTCPINSLIRKSGTTLVDGKYDYRASAFLVQPNYDNTMPMYMNCVLESFLRNNPNFKLYIFASKWKSPSLLKYKQFKRVFMLRQWNFSDFSKLEPSLASKINFEEANQKHVQSISDTVSLIILKHCGGLLLNHGLLVMRSLAQAPLNFIGTYLSSSGTTRPSKIIIRLEPLHRVFHDMKSFPKVSHNTDMNKVWNNIYKKLPAKFCKHTRCPSISYTEDLIHLYNHSTFSRISSNQAYLLFELLDIKELSPTASLMPPYGLGIYIWPEQIYREIIMTPFHYFHSNKAILRVFNNSCPNVMSNDYLNEEHDSEPGTYLIFHVLTVEFTYPKSGQIIRNQNMKDPNLAIHISSIMKETKETIQMTRRLLKSTLHNAAGDIIFCVKDWREEYLANDPFDFNECHDVVYENDISVTIDANKKGHHGILGQMFARKPLLMLHLRKLTNNKSFQNAPCFKYIESEVRFVLDKSRPKSVKAIEKRNSACFIKIAPPAITSFTLI